MPLSITLKTGSEVYGILQCRYGFGREVSPKGLPLGGMAGGRIVLTMESTESSLLLERLVGSGPKDNANPRPFAGSLEICEVEDGTPVRTIVWDEGFLYSLGENMQGDGSLPMTLALAISPLRLDIDKNIRLDRRFPQTYGFWWEEYKPEERAARAGTSEKEEEKEQYKSKIKVPSPYQDMLKSDLQKVFAGKSNSFSFSDDEFLVLDGKLRDFENSLFGDQKLLFVGLRKVMTAGRITTIVYENHYNSIDVVVKYGGGLYSKPDRTIVIAPNVGYVTVDTDPKKDAVGNFVSIGMQKVVVEQNSTSTLFHELGEVNAGNSAYRGDVITYENCARRILMMPHRPTDTHHSYNVPLVNGNIYSQ